MKYSIKLDPSTDMHICAIAALLRTLPSELIAQTIKQCVTPHALVPPIRSAKAIPPTPPSTPTAPRIASHPEPAPAHEFQPF